jgi:hypothetical protein
MNRQFGGSAAVLLSAAIVGVSGCGERTRSSADTSASGRQVVSAGATATPAPMRSPMSRTAVAQGASTTSPVPATATRSPASVRPSAGAARDTGGGTPADTAKRPSAAPVAQSTVAPTPAAPPAPPAPPAPSKLAVALAHLPFADQERLEYQVKYGFLGVGSAVLQVQGLDTVRGTTAVHATFTVNGGVRIYRVNDHYESWFDPISFSTLRATQKIDEGSYDRQRNFEFFPERRTFTENTNPETATVPDPLDEASFIFFLRTIPLDIGQTYEFTRYFRLDKNPVRVIVERKEHIKVPAGEFNTVVVRPIIKTTGIFGEGGKAEVWFTDDSTRTLVQLKSSLKFGSLNLYLRNRQVGTPWPGAATVPSPTP